MRECFVGVVQGELEGGGAEMGRRGGEVEETSRGGGKGVVMREEEADQSQFQAWKG